MREPPKCPHCDQPLKPFEGEGFDWVCTCHNNFRSNKPYAYYWNGEFPRDAEVPVSAPVPQPTKPEFLCAARHSDTGANDPQECDWPFCGCDVYADKVIEAIQESGFILVKSAAPVPERTNGICRDHDQLHAYDPLACVGWHPARKDELGTCPGESHPHTEADHEALCYPIKNKWTPVAPQASPEAPAKEDVMADFRSWYRQEGSAKFDDISQRHYEPDDCTDTQLIMQEVAELTWARARLRLSGSGK